MHLPCCCLIGRYSLALIYLQSNIVKCSAVASKPVMEEVIFLRHHCLQMWSNCMVSWCKKKNRHFQKMKCFERNEWGRESPLMETSNVNSQRESRVGDKNQFHKVWSFHQEGPPNADLTDDQSKSLYIYSAWQYSKAFFFTHSYTRYVFICFNSKLHEQSDPENARYF